MNQITGSANFRPQDLLEKHGWKSGCGLGKNEHGIKSAIKVNIKNDNAGIGHDAGAEFTFHWWDHVYNSAANSIKVVKGEDGIRVSKLSDFELSTKKQQAKLATKNLLYGRFVKSATLTNDGEEVKETAEQSSESDDSDDDIGTASKITDDELFKKLGGLTGHKAARHGHRLNGKLARLNRQETTSKCVSSLSTAPIATDLLSRAASDVDSANRDDCSKRRSRLTIKEKDIVELKSGPDTSVIDATNMKRKKKPRETKNISQSTDLFSGTKTEADELSDMNLGGGHGSDQNAVTIEDGDGFVEQDDVRHKRSEKKLKRKRKDKKLDIICESDNVADIPDVGNFLKEPSKNKRNHNADKSCKAKCVASLQLSAAKSHDEIFDDQPTDQNGIVNSDIGSSDNVRHIKRKKKCKRDHNSQVETHDLFDELATHKISQATHEISQKIVRHQKEKKIRH